MINASQKGQRGKMSERLVEMNVRWQPNMKTLLRRLDSPRWAPAPALSGFQVLRDFMSRSRILRQRKGLN